ncbi:MAG: transketolase [Pseudomonadota bacterium]
MPDTAAPAPRALSKRDLISGLETLEDRLLWLSSWTIHHANHVRENRDGLKVGGHQASCASITTIMTALYFHALRVKDRVAVKPHAAPVLHAIEYLLGRQDLDQLKGFRGLGGAQSYPSRTKDKIRVDFSTGSVGLGVAVTAFASLVQDMLLARGALGEQDASRFIALLGDAELDEGNIYEALIEAYKHDIRNTWWIVDYNRQSLDATTSERMFDRFDDIFETAGWTVQTLKYGARQRAAFRKAGGAALRDWIDACPNDLFSALTYEGGAAWRKRLERDHEGAPATLKLVASFSDDELATLMTDLGGHCFETLLAAYEKASASETPTLIIAYTVKGRRLPFQGHKDNHAGLMTPTQIDTLRETTNVPAGEEWSPWGGVDEDAKRGAERVVRAADYPGDPPARLATAIDVPSWADLPDPGRKAQSTQVAFGKVLSDLAREDSDFVNRIVTTSPDVTVSTNLGGFVNRRGLFSRHAAEDVFKKRKIASPQIWAHTPTGQHLELGIAENNLFLALAALGLSADLFGERLFPIGTVYDPFIARGLDALNYACYQDARFILAATPSGVTLAPEGGAHQSISSPAIGVSQPGLTYYEPAFADEVRVLMAEAFDAIQRTGGGSTYLRLSTRAVDQPDREMTDGLAADIRAGAYWAEPPGPGAEFAVVYAGALAPEARAAWRTLKEDCPQIGLLAVTSPDKLHHDWTERQATRWTGGGEPHARSVLSALPAGAGLITLIDGAPLTLSWLGSVDGRKVSPLGVQRFGQTGDLPDLYETYRLDERAVLDAAAVLLAG